jgi:dinuclear metal center YbgI/SA1388 family protein
MKQAEFIELLEHIAPPELADDFDAGRIGLVIDLLHENNREIQRVAVTLDVTKEILLKAAAFKADVLICHHTPLFHPITTISGPLAQRLKIVFENNISIYAMHTNYDNAEGGINTILADKFQLKNQKMTAFGIIGTIDPLSTDDFAKKVSKELNTPLMYAGSRTVEKIMICGGSCLNRHALSVAQENGVDLFLSSELKHSDFLRERGDMSVIDAGHYATENPGMEALALKLKEKIGDQVDVLFIEDDPQLKSL